MSEELKPCPFCGESSDCIILIVHEPHTHSIATFMHDHPGSATIECGGCNVGMIEDDAEKVAAACNHHAQFAAPVAAQEPLGEGVQFEQWFASECPGH